MGISKQAFYALYKSKEFEPDTIKKIEKATDKKWQDIKKVNVDVNGSVKQPDEAEPQAMREFDQPMIQVILNLTYVSRKNAESIDKMADGVNVMAATNQRNTEIIAALVNTIIPNSNLAEKLTASLAGSQEDDEVPPIEEMLNEAGMNFLKQQMQAGIKKAGSK